MVIWEMKTTIEIPDSLFRRAKATAAERGQTLKQFFTEALKARLDSQSATHDFQEPRWMSGFGGLAHLRKETARIQNLIDDTFESIDDEDRS